MCASFLSTGTELKKDKIPTKFHHSNTTMDPELNRLEKDFSIRLDRWISKQGILFQLRHSSGAGSVLPKLFALLFRLFIVLLIGLIIFWFYLKNRPNSESYKEDLATQIKAGTNAESVEIKSVERYKGGLLDAQLKISNFTLGGSETSFYEDWYAEEKERDINGNVYLEKKRKQLVVQAAVVQPLGIGDGILHGWSGKKITLGSLQCHLKTGAETNEKAMASYLSLFKGYDSLTVNNIIIDEANIGWGYEISKGSIKGAAIEALKQNGVWKITVTGGTFSHGWLQNAGIKTMSIECHDDGLVKIVSAELRIGDGTISFDAEIQIKSKPVVKGKFEFKGIEVIDLVGKEYAAWLDGQVQGKGTLDGTLNSLSGIKSVTTVTLNAPPTTPATPAGETAIVQKVSSDDSFLVIRGKFPILKAMQRINGVNSYNLLRLNIGEFIIEQTGGDTTIRDINVRSDDFLIVNGGVKYVWTSLREKNAKKVDPDSELKSLIDEKEKASEDKDLAGGNRPGDRLVKTFSGELTMGFIPQVFEAYPEILKVYPEDANTIRVWIPVPMAGEMREASSSTADKLNKIVQEAREKKENN